MQIASYTIWTRVTVFISDDGIHYTTSTLPTYLYVTSSSSSSYGATGTDFPDPLLPIVFIVHLSRQVFPTTSCISTELF